MTATNTCLKCTTGLFANATSAACEPCSVAECLQCSTLTTCQTCNYTGAFYVAPDFTCAYCDPLANDFINMTTLDCQACSLDHCTTCASLTQCTTCDTGADYFLNTTLGLCQACGVILAGCLDCNDFSTCIVCDPTGFVPTGSTCTPICGDGLVRSY